MSLVPLHWADDRLVPEVDLPYEPVNHNTEVTILHTNDFHSCIDSFPDGSGGIARIATTIRLSQSSAPVIVVDAGDSVFGSPTVWSTQGAGPTARLRGMAGYQLAALGNHDLEHGAEGVRELLDGGYRLVANNIEFDDPDLQTQIAPAYMTSVDGIRIGFTGVTTPDTVGLVPKRVLAGVRFVDDAVKSTQRTVRALEPHVDVVIVLSHLGFDPGELMELMPAGQTPKMMLENDRRLVAQLKGTKVAAILGGHTHDALAPTPVLAGIAVCNAGAYGRKVGEMKLGLSADGVVEVRHALIDQDVSVAEDATLVEARERERELFAASMEQSVLLPAGAVPVPELTAKQRQDSLLARALQASADVTDSSIMFIPQLYLLGELPESERLRLVDVRVAYPNAEKLVEITLDGADLTRLLQLQEQLMFFEAATPVRLANQQPVSVADIDADAIYAIITSELEAEGGLGWTVFPAAAKSIRALDITCAEVVWSYLLSSASSAPAAVGAGVA